MIFRNGWRSALWLLAMMAWLAMIAVPGGAQPPSRKKVSKPNLDIHVYRRANTPDETVSLQLTAYNQKRIHFALYRLSLPALTPNAKALETLGKQIKALNLSRLSQIRAWDYPLGRTYPDQWEERTVKLPRLPPGTYLAQATGGGVERRTWLAITDVALLAKRSRQEMLIYAARAHSGKPVAGLRLAFADNKGRVARQTTDAQGICRLPWKPGDGSAWIYGEQNGSPAFVLAGAPPAPEPYAAYTATDRPIYRPGHKVLYKTTIRERVESDTPGGFAQRPYTRKPVQVEIRDSSDALVSRQTVTTNAYGSLDGAFQLASEPTLGRWQIVVVIGASRAYANFEVQAYRKPEFSVTVQVPQAHYLGGATVPVTIDARYYFGQPVADAAVNYAIRFQPESSPRGANAAPEPPYNGQGVTDAQGRLKLDIKTQHLPMNRRMFVVAQVTDLSRRTQSADGGALITGGMFQLRLETDKSVYKAGDTMRVTAYATDYDGKPVATPLRVRLIETKYNRDHKPYQEITTHDVVTDGAGKGVTTFTPPRPGYLQLEAQAFDAGQNKILTASSVWIAGADEGDFDYPTLSLLADKTSYRPGETATVLLNTSLVAGKKDISRRDAEAQRGEKGRGKRKKNERPVYREGWALVTVEGERLYQHRLVHLTGHSTMLPIALTNSDFPSVEVSVTLLQEKQVYQQQARLTVQRDAQKLKVSIAPDKEKYAPGETATYTVTTRNAAGRPVPAEVGFGLVDASIYAILPDNTPDIEGFFYSGQQNRIATDFSFAAQYSGGAFQTMPRDAAPGIAKAAQGGGKSPGADIRVRRQFADTAYWNPFVQTDEYGAARVTLTLPDNLTTWRATARGITLQTSVGTATQDSVSTMPLLVRLTLPRFYVQGDQAIVSAIVHNYTGVTRDVVTRIEASGADLQGDATRTIQLAPGGEKRLDWMATIRPAGTGNGAKNSGPQTAAVLQNLAPNLSYPTSGVVKFLVTADGGEGAQDATELTLPAQADGVKMVEARADTVTDAGAGYRQDIGSLPPGTSLTVTLAPSIASAMFDALDYLTSYPYGCAEQTMSSFLPDVIAADTLHRLNVTRKVHPNLSQWVNLGLQKLYRYQHGDGGWNWWEFDQTDPDMTAYVLWGLLQAKQAGYLVDEQRILRGTQALLNLLKNEQEWNRRAEDLLTLASAQPGSILKPLSQLYDNREKLDAFSLASLCMALTKVAQAVPPIVGQPDLRMLAQGVAQELAAKAVAQGTTNHWSSVEGGYSWRNDDVFVTARVLRALLTVTPRSPLIEPTVRWLMGNRSGKEWNSTRTSAEVVIALAQYLQQTDELHPHYTAALRLDGQTVQTLNVNFRTVFDAPLAVTLTPEQLQGHTALTLDKQGAGTLYVTTTQTYTVPSAEAKPLRKGIAVHRAFQVLAEDPSRADGIPSGQEMEVQLEITADADYRYAMLEEPIPAGCEVAPGNEQMQPYGLMFAEGGVGGYVRQEVRDNRVVFFFDSLPKGKTRLLYRLHAETPGLYRILPGVASLAYFPEIRGHGLPVKARITEK